MKLNIWKEGQDDIQEMLHEYPNLQKYYDMVANNSPWSVYANSNNVKIWSK